jgi:hypothetical protein
MCFGYSTCPDHVQSGMSLIMSAVLRHLLLLVCLGLAQAALPACPSGASSDAYNGTVKIASSCIWVPADTDTDIVSVAGHNGGPGVLPAVMLPGIVHAVPVTHSGEGNTLVLAPCHMLMPSRSQSWTACIVCSCTAVRHSDEAPYACGGWQGEGVVTKHNFHL